MIYATTLNDWNAIEKFTVESGRKKYVFGQHSIESSAVSDSPTSKFLNTSMDFSHLLPHISNIFLGNSALNIDHSHHHFHNKIIHSNFTSSHLNESILLLHSASYSVAAQFRSLFPKPVKMWFGMGGRGSDILQGILKMGQEMTLNGYQGHVFYFTYEGEEEDSVNHIKRKKDIEIARFTLVPTVFLYVVRPSKEEDLALVPKQLLEIDKKQMLFNEEYFNKTGLLWRHYFDLNGPRPPPVLFMWPAAFIGQTHEVVSPEAYWFCEGNSKTCQEKEPISFTLEVKSTHPKVFIITEFLSEFECDAIINIAKPKIHKSTIGNADIAGGAHESETRTSSNAWVARETSEITQSLYRRAAHVLKVDEKLLTPQKSAEEMQVVHYLPHQKYDAHHDWGVSGRPETRFITLLIYLTDMVSENAGGETSFPKGANGEGFKVRPVKGNAVLFYNLLEDGNGDDLALHAALPVVEGEKWLANFWVWDPHR